jgi:hypothetical protein
MKVIYVWILLMVLTAATLSLNYFNVSPILIFVFFSVKFLLVSFQFMELNKAHVFWKASIVMFVSIINSIILLI